MRSTVCFAVNRTICKIFNVGYAYTPRVRPCPLLRKMIGGLSGESGMRGYFTALYDNVQEKKKLEKEMDDLYDNIITSNWNDSVHLVLNVSIWEGILKSIEEKIKAYECDEDIVKKKKELNELFDVLFILEDLRDHINEILEQSSRASGLAGAHILSSFKINNINEHIDFLKKKYEQLLLIYPKYKYQINLVLGKGLALLRQRYSFDWNNMHQFFF
ncbi:conserved Plasmodium protein, unknown function [Plasmodium ovale wallikeri]|uniref:DUF6827 domain-containing protein n=2 Tax=Plasmodium ovale TaxID=36330 RepID=A0A1A8Z8E4_PLAOA|nr:conserved Plasmodium protein, unknown function [Plasmodium ovale wallikeri]SBT40512.1 conserved Plasmodium protein, unknown function [Plasmodium ovale wallikeri]